MSAQTSPTEPSRLKHERISGAAIISALLLLSQFVQAGRALGVAGPHGTVNLITASSSVEPQRPFCAGLHFHLEPGWHIYWTNPGDSGEPPRIRWNLPAGFQAGPLLWPKPSRIEDHSLIDFGYQNDVLLPVEITVPGTARVGSSVQLDGTVSWLVCREICVPGHADLTLTLPVRNVAPSASAEHALFARARADVPAPAPKSWKVTSRLEAHTFVLDIQAVKREAGATFFPLEPNQIENAAPQKAIPSPRGIQLELVKSDQMLKPPLRLTGVVELPSGQAYVIDAPVVASK
jgi:thiol:disulfide interchange protein DsbD